MERILITGSPNFLSRKLEEALATDYKILGSHTLLDRVTADFSVKGRAKLIHFSSVDVFSGNHGNYAETDIPDSKTPFGMDRQYDETIALQTPGALVLRLGLLYGFNGIDNDSGLFGRVIHGEDIHLDDSKVKQPLLADDIAPAIKLLIEGSHTGVFHLAGPTNMTEFKLGELLAFQIDRNTTSVLPVKGEGANFTLATSKAEELGVQFTPVEEAMLRLRKQVIEEKLHKQTLRWANRWARPGGRKIV